MVRERIIVVDRTRTIIKPGKTTERDRTTEKRITGPPTRRPPEPEATAGEAALGCFYILVCMMVLGGILQMIKLVAESPSMR